MSNNLYNQYYTTENLFGEAYKELVSFFENYSHKGHVLDLGCGQGRDAIALAKIGYTVTGVDNSNLGVEQMLSIAEKDKLPVSGKVDDVYSFTITTKYDIVLLDSMFHFYKKDKTKEIAFIERIMEELKLNGIICICINHSGTKVKTLKSIFSNSAIPFEIINDNNFYYSNIYEGQQLVSKYKMFIVKKG